MIRFDIKVRIRTIIIHKTTMYACNVLTVAVVSNNRWTVPRWYRCIDYTYIQ